MSALGRWLEAVGLGQYAGLFAENRIELDVLPDLGEQDLEKLGIPLGDRKRLIKAIATLAPAPQEAAQAAAQGPEATVERRQVTVLFVDLSGYTRLTNTLGAEATHTLVQRFYERVSAIVRSHSGTVERHIGDAIMAVFGLPVAHGNDTERALRAALAIHDAMPSLSDEVGHPLSVHIGIANGQVVASHAGQGRDFSTVGDAVNLAARLVGLAGPGETVLSDAVRREVEHLCTAEPIGEVRVKGFDRPVAAWRATGLKSGAAPGRVPLVGRSTELRQFRAVCEACRDERAGQIVLVRGEAGIGKTRLVEEFEAMAAAAGFAACKGLALDFGLARTQGAVARIVAGVLQCDAPGNAAACERALASAVASGLVVGDEAMYAADLLGVAPPRELQPVYEAMENAVRARERHQFVARLLQRAAAHAPLLVTVEDIHWADDALLDALAEIGAGIERHRVILLLTTRPETDPLGAAWRARAGPRVGMLTLDVRPLRDAEAVELARMLGAETGAMLAECVRRAEGNPLFLEQLLRNAIAGDRDALPGSVQSIVLARLDRLQSRDRRAIQAASVLGQCFSLEVLRELLGDAGYTCAALVAANLLRPMGGEFLFAHALVWEGTYASLLGDQKRRWHVAAAGCYASRDAALAAEHYERAQDPRAARAYLEAARAEQALCHTERAVHLLERGLALATEAADTIALLADLGALLPTAGRPLQAIDAFERLLALAQDDRQRCRARIGIASGLRMLDRQQEALDQLAQAEALAEPGCEAERAQIHYLRGSLFFPLGDVAGCLAEQTRALQHARAAGSIELQLRALSGLGDAHYAAGRIASAYRHFKQCVELSREHRFGQIEAANLPMVAFSALLMGNFDEAQETAEAAVSLARRTATRRAQIVAHHGCAMAYMERGDIEGARPHAQAAVDVSRAIGARRFEPESMLLVAVCLQYEGRRAEAAAMLREALAMAREHISYCGPMILGALARVTREPAERRRCLEEGEQIVDAGCPSHNHIFFCREAIEASLEAEDCTGALRYADRMATYFREESIPFVDYIVARGRALASVAQGRRDGALRAELQDLVGRTKALRLVHMLPALEAAAAAPGWALDGASPS